MATIVVILSGVIAYITLKSIFKKLLKNRNKGKRKEDVQQMEMKKLNRKQRQIIKNLPFKNGETSQFLELD